MFLPLLAPAPAGLTAPPSDCNLRVHILDARSDAPRGHVPVTLRILAAPRPKNIHMLSDAGGNVCFLVTVPPSAGITVEAESARYASRDLDAIVSSIPAEVTLHVKHRRWYEKLRYLLRGD